MIKEDETGVKKVKFYDRNVMSYSTTQSKWIENDVDNTPSSVNKPRIGIHENCQKSGLEKQART